MSLPSNLRFSSLDELDAEAELDNFTKEKVETSQEYEVLFFTLKIQTKTLV